MQLDDRKKLILAAVVNLYIETGEPVGSKLLVHAAGLNLSSATFRNEMSELADSGLLEQPHTSAGRVPSQLGYRVYVDSLMGAYELTSVERQQLDGLMRIDGADLESMLEKAGEFLAQVTGCVTVSAVQQVGDVTVRRIEIVSASRRSALVVLLVSSGVIKSRVCRAGEDLSAEMLSFFERLVNEKIVGRQLSDVTEALVQEIEDELYEYTLALKPVLTVIYEEIHGLTSSEVFLGGETNLLNHAAFYGDKAIDLIRYLEKKDGLGKLFEGLRDDVQVRIGNEIGSALMQNSSMIAAPYGTPGKSMGAIGIIGPTRMNYSRLKSHIKYFSGILSKLIKDTFSD